MQNITHWRQKYQNVMDFLSWLHYKVLSRLLWLLIHMTNVWNHVISYVHPAGQTANFHDNNSNIGHYTNFSTKFIHTCHGHSHHGPQAFQNIFSSLDLGWGSRGQCNTKHLWFIFLHTVVLSLNNSNEGIGLPIWCSSVYPILPLETKTRNEIWFRLLLSLIIKVYSFQKLNRVVICKCHQNRKVDIFGCFGVLFALECHLTKNYTHMHMPVHMHALTLTHTHICTQTCTHSHKQYVFVFFLWWRFSSIKTDSLLFGCCFRFPWQHYVLYCLNNIVLVAIAFDHNSETKSIHLLLQGYQKMLDKLNFKRDKIVDIQKALQSADINQDKQLDFDEWRQDLKT